MANRGPRLPRWGRWLAPATAAVAVLAVAIALVLARNAPDGAGAATTALVAIRSDSVPAYYVALDGTTNGNPASPKVVVGDTGTGKRLLTLGPFAAGGAVSVTAAADDRTFVVGTEHYRPPAPPTPTAWYLVRLRPGTPVRGTVRALHIPALSGGIDAMALAPDGTELAILGQQYSPRTGATVLRVYSVATGKLLRWWSQPITRGGLLPAPGSLSWTGGGRGLGFNYAKSPFSMGVWLLAVNRPGHGLLADSRLVWSTQIAGTFDQNRPRKFSCAGVAPSALVTADGKTVVCGAWGVFRNPGNLPDGICPAARAWNDVGFPEYSTATGKLARTLYSDATSCVLNAQPATVLWASADGGTLAGYFTFGGGFPIPTTVIRFGVFRNHTFTKLPVPPSTDPGTIAW